MGGAVWERDYVVDVVCRGYTLARKAEGLVASLTLLECMKCFEMVMDNIVLTAMHKRARVNVYHTHVLERKCKQRENGFSTTPSAETAMKPVKHKRETTVAEAFAITSWQYSEHVPPLHNGVNNVILLRF